MLKHIVMWRFKEGAEGKSRLEHAQHLEALVGVVSEIRSLEVGVNINPGEAAYDAVLVSTFDDLDSMQRYQKHPAHLEVAAYCKQVCEVRSSVDYEI